jgi:outer membrane protein
MRTSFWSGSPVLVLALVAAQAASAADLIEAWRGAAQNDSDYAVARAAHLAAQPRRDQAAALWRPNVGLTASAGISTHETDTRGAQFSAPGFGLSNGANFNTSVTNGMAGRWAISASQPLYHPERRAQQQQLALSVDLANLEWQAAGQTLIIRTAEHYFDVALADEALRVLNHQLSAVQRTSTEMQDRFRLGSVPVTDVHEASARLAGIRAQVLAAERDVQVKRKLLADSTGLPAPAARLPVGRSAGIESRPLDLWLAEAQAGNPGLRMQGIAADIAKQESTKYSLRASVTVELVAQASRDRLSGSGDYGSSSNTATNRMIGVQVSVPLFTGGYRDAKQEEALRLAEKAQAEVARTRQQLAQQVLSVWLGLSVGAEREQALSEALKAGEARREATQLGHQVGHRTTLDLLNAESDTAAARLALAQARVGLLMDRLRLAALVGQLDDGTLRSVNEDLQSTTTP